MKKYLFLIPLFLMVLLPSCVFAYSYDKNGETIEVTNDTSVYYLYSQYPQYFTEYSNFVVNGQDSAFYGIFTNGAATSSSGYVFVDYSVVGSYIEIYCSYSKDECTVTEKTKNAVYYPINNILYSNYSISNKGNNITLSDITDYFGTIPTYTITYYLNNELYKTLEVEKGSSHTIEEYTYNTSLYTFSGWVLETTDVDLSNITDNVVIRATLEAKTVNPVYINNFPVTKNEFYVLLVLISTLIMMQFLKWCFPFKGGSDFR